MAVKPGALAAMTALWTKLESATILDGMTCIAAAAGRDASMPAATITAAANPAAICFFTSNLHFNCRKYSTGPLDGRAGNILLLPQKPTVQTSADAWH